MTMTLHLSSKVNSIKSGRIYTYVRPVGIYFSIMTAGLYIITYEISSNKERETQLDDRI